MKRQKKILLPLIQVGQLSVTDYSLIHFSNVKLLRRSLPLTGRLDKRLLTEKLLKLILTINAPITTKVVCFSRLLKCLRSLYGKQCGSRSDCSYPIGAVCSGSMLFAPILNSSVILGNYLQQTTFSDAFFSWCFKG